MKEANANPSGNSCGSSASAGNTPDVGVTKHWEKPILIEGYEEATDNCGDGNYYVKCDSGGNGML